jgi:hypothetical protein
MERHPQSAALFMFGSRPLFSLRTGHSSTRSALWQLATDWLQPGARSRLAPPWRHGYERIDARPPCDVAWGAGLVHHASWALKRSIPSEAFPVFLQSP